MVQLNYQVMQTMQIVEFIHPFKCLWKTDAVAMRIILTNEIKIKIFNFKGNSKKKD